MPKDKVASETLGQRLRDIRKSKGVSGVRKLAGLMKGKYSYSSISRREDGLIKIDSEYLTDFCDALKLTKEERQALKTSARVSLLRPKSQIAESVEEWSRIILEAGHFSSYTANVVCYPLQTYNYVYSLITTYGEVAEPEKFAKLRAQRAEHELGDPSKRFQILCHEHALYFSVGDASIMAEQMERLVDFVHNPRVELRILPRNVFVPVVGNFSMGIIDSTYCFCENRLDLSITDNPETVRRFVGDFDALWKKSLAGEDCRHILKTAKEYWEAQ